VHDDMLKTSTAHLDQDAILMQTPSGCDETRGDELAGWSVDWIGWSIGWKKRKIWYLLTYIERNSIPVSSSIYQNLLPFSTYSRNRYSYIWRKTGLFYPNFQLRRLVFLLAFLLDCTSTREASRTCNHSQ
jgi:hypothetical protein